MFANINLLILRMPFIKTRQIIKLLLILAITGIFAGTTKGQERIPSTAKQKQVALYSTNDIIFRYQVRKGEDPFDVTFGAVFEGPDNSRLTINGFFNGKDEFIIRFSPMIMGSWSYHTFSSVAGLSGEKDVVEVIENNNPEVNGPVIIDPQSPQKFAFHDGTPYFALAFEIDWLFALDLNNPADIPNTRKIVEVIKKNGFNQVVMNLYAYDVKWKVGEDVPAKYNFKEPAVYPFAGTNETPDFKTLNVDFFQHLDRVIDHLHKSGIVAHMMIYVWNKEVNWPPMYSWEDNRFFDYVINRYQGYSNIIWDVSKEALDYGRCDIPYINERIERIRKSDAYSRLITVHDYEYCSREPGRVDFISIQNWRSDLYSYSLEALLLHNDKPVINIEHGGYEEGPFLSYQGNYINPEVCLIRNYQVAFAGVYSTYYWQNTAWNIVIYDPFESEHVVQKPRFDYYKHMNDLFSKYDYNKLMPAKQKLTTNSIRGMDNLSSSGYALTNGKNLYLYLVPPENHQIAAVVPEPENGMLQATWFNLFTGEYISGGTQEWGRWPNFQSPWENQYSVLILSIN
jgi:hypothetical protein